MSNVNLNQLIENFGHLPVNDKEYFVDVIKKQLIESKRDVIARRAKEAMSNLKKGMVKRGTIKELAEDLDSD